MVKTPLARLAAVAAGGVFVLAAAGPALAHDAPANGFNAVLHGPHHGVLAAAGEFDKCSTVKQDAGDAANELIKDGFDVWVFNAAPNEFDPTESVTTLRVTFSDPADGEVTVTVPGEFDSWIGPDANPHLVAVAVPAGWTLLDGDFNVVGNAASDVVVTHTCAGTAGDNGGNGNGGNGNGNGGNGDGGENGDQGENGSGGGAPGEGDGSGAGLPVTGVQVGGLVVLGAGLLAAGAAMLAVRRRRGVSGLIDG